MMIYFSITDIINFVVDFLVVTISILFGSFRPSVLYKTAFTTLINLNTGICGFFMHHIARIIVITTACNFSTALTNVHISTNIAYSEFAEVYALFESIVTTEVIGIAFSAILTGACYSSALITGCTVHHEAIFIYVSSVVVYLLMMIYFSITDIINFVVDFLVVTISILFGSFRPSVLYKTAFTTLINLNTGICGFFMHHIARIIVITTACNFSTALTNVHISTNIAYSEFAEVYALFESIVTTEVIGIAFSAILTGACYSSALVTGRSVHHEAIFIIMLTAVSKFCMMIYFASLYIINCVISVNISAVSILFGNFGPNILYSTATHTLINFNACICGFLMVPSAILIAISVGNLITALANVHISISAAHSEITEFYALFTSVVTAEGIGITFSAILTGVSYTSALSTGCTIHNEAIFIIMITAVSNSYMMIYFASLYIINCVISVSISAVSILFGNFGPSILYSTASLTLVNLNTCIGGFFANPLTVTVIIMTTGIFTANFTNAYVCITTAHSEVTEFNVLSYIKVTIEIIFIAISTVLTGIDDNSALFTGFTVHLYLFIVVVIFRIVIIFNCEDTTTVQEVLTASCYHYHTIIIL